MHLEYFYTDWQNNIHEINTTINTTIQYVINQIISLITHGLTHCHNCEAFLSSFKIIYICSYRLENKYVAQNQFKFQNNLDSRVNKKFQLTYLYDSKQMTFTHNVFKHFYQMEFKNSFMFISFH